MAWGFDYSRNSPSDQQSALGVAVASSAGLTLLLERLRWPIAVFAVVVQQGAFVSSPVLGKFAATIGSDDPQANILNTLAVLLNILFIAPYCLLYFRQFINVIYRNKIAIALMMLMFLSTIWSIHPDVTLRRDINYVSTVLTAFYLASQFDFDDIIMVLSRGIAISVVFSFLFVAAFPADAIHQQSQWHLTDFENVAGDWKGVFSHKNVLGHVMSVGVFAELYILTATKLRSFWPFIWHLLLLCGCIALIVLARSTTAVVLTSLYFLGAILFVVLQHARPYFMVFLTMLAVICLAIVAIFWAYPDLIFGILGSDPTFTGRTAVWTLVLNLIWERPLLGWGYSAMWLKDDTITLAISNAVGWAVPEAHNALLEVALGLGLVGLVIVVAYVALSVWRAVRCLVAGLYSIGIYSLTFFVGINLSGITESMLVQNQSIEWVVFSMLSVCCGLEIARQQISDELSYGSESDIAPAYWS
jgi:exopolysaccharide production protein ExoQ